MNKRTLARQAAAAASGLMPLDYMLQQMRDETLEPKERMYAASQAAPYLHARLQSIDTRVSGDIRVEIVKFSDADSRKAA